MSIAQDYQSDKEIYRIQSRQDLEGPSGSRPQNSELKRGERNRLWSSLRWKAEAYSDKSNIELECSPRNHPSNGIESTLESGCFEDTSQSSERVKLQPSNKSAHLGFVRLRILMQHHITTPLKRFNDWICRHKEYVPDPLGRSLHIKPKDRIVYLERRTQRPYIGNHITSSRYTVYDFLPRQLAFQFSKVANIYFLTVSILQMIPGLSTTGTYTTIIPLSIFLSIAIAREGYDDLRRHRMDTVEDETSVTRMELCNADENMKAAKTSWYQLKVGDIVRLQRNEWIPADIVLLRSEQEDDTAYIETAALDGETNLKAKRAIPMVAEKCVESRLAQFDALIESEAPNKDLYNYDGSITCADLRIPLGNDHIIYRGSILRNTSSILGVVVFTGEETKIRLNASAQVRTKRPSMQALVNKVVMAVAAFVIFLAIFCTCGYYVWHSDLETRLWYLNAATSISFFPIFVSFLILYNTMVPLSLYVSMEIVKLIQQLLLQQDIDLFHAETNTPLEARTATINEELGQVTHIFSDKTGTLTDNEMVFRKISVAGHAWYHESQSEHDKHDEQPFLRHKMRKENFTMERKSTTALDTNHKRFSLDYWRKFSFSYTNAPKSSIQALPKLSTTSRRRRSSNHENDTATEWSTEEMLLYIQEHSNTVFARRAKFFLLSIALCHTALPNDSKTENKSSFSAASPDELALVTAAMDLGYLLVDRTTQSVKIRIASAIAPLGYAEEVYRIHEVLEFSSIRKRMSIIFSFPDGRLCIFCKGADSVLLERLRHKDLARKKHSEVTATADLRKSFEAGQALARKSMARPSISRPSMSGGSRIDSMRELDRFFDPHHADIPRDESRDQIREYAMRHSIAFGESFKPISKSKVSSVDETAANNEAVVLQRTFEHLDSFATEGLRVLMYGHRFLSRDEHSAWQQSYNEASISLSNRQQKLEIVAEKIEKDLEFTGVTAIEDKLQEGVPASIEKLHRAGIKMWMLTGDKRETAINIGHSTGLIKDYSTIIVLDSEEPDILDLLNARLEDLANGRLAHSVVVIDGMTLQFIDQDPVLSCAFIRLAVAADTAVCCRASPSQKAALVHRVRKELPSAIALAIGDGANDIAMIKEAHIGIGIAGKEGLQAARSSDYSIAQFRFLVKLLLVHGRWNYMRICKYVLGTFYKEILLFLTQAIYQHYAGYTGTSLHESWSLSLFNTLFSSLAVICLGAFEKDLSASTLLAVPELYETTRRGMAFSIKIFLGWMLLAAIQSVLCFYLAYLAFGRPASHDLFPFGDMIFTAIVIVINVKLIFIEMHAWSILNYTFFAISFIGWWVWQLLQATLYGPTRIYYVQEAFVKEFGRSACWWASIAFVTLVLLLFDTVVQVTRSTFMPTEEDKFRELQTDKALKARLEEEAAQELQAGWIEDLLAKRGVASDEV